MAEAAHDNNRVSTLMGVSSTDGVTPIAVKVDSVTGRLLMKAQTTGTHSSVTNRIIAYRDQNRVTVAMGESSADDGVLVNVVANSSGYLRIKSA